MNKSIDYVVTYYNGDLNIIREKVNFLKETTDYNINLIIYNKKDDNIGIKIKNIGVDSYTDIYHIIKNYNNLADITIFSTDSMYSTKKKIKKIEFIINNIDKCNGFLTGHIIKNKKEHNFTLDVYRNKKLIKSPIRPFIKWFQYYINKNKKITDYIYSCKKSTFAVTKECILSNSKEYYEMLLDHIEKYSNYGHDSEVPHYFERSWVELFCKDDVLKMYHNIDEYGKLL